MPLSTLPRDNTYSAAEEKGWEDLIHLDAKSIARNSLAEYDGKLFRMNVLEEEVIIDKWKGSITSRSTHDRTFDVLVLHYLTGCRSSGPSGELVLFRQLKGGEAFNEAFQKRVIDRIAVEFGDYPSLLLAAGKELNGLIRSKGSASIELQLFPKVMVTVIVWKGDGEVPHSATVLFDKSIGDILPTEDVAVACSYILERLVQAKSRTFEINRDR